MALDLGCRAYARCSKKKTGGQDAIAIALSAEGIALSPLLTAAVEEIIL